MGGVPPRRHRQRALTENCRDESTSSSRALLCHSIQAGPKDGGQRYRRRGMRESLCEGEHPETTSMQTSTSKHI